MDPINAACKAQFRAYHHSGYRSLLEIRWIVIHDEEAPNARGSAEYFARRSSGGSAHLCIDEKECYRCLWNNQVPWGASSAPEIGANHHGFHIELAGYAEWSEAQWASHRDELQRAAYKTAIHAKRFEIPLHFVPEDQLPRASGITTHAEISAASRRLDPGNRARYSHYDPGPHFPMSRFLDLVRRFAARGLAA